MKFVIKKLCSNYLNAFWKCIIYSIFKYFIFQKDLTIIFFNVKDLTSYLIFILLLFYISIIYSDLYAGYGKKKYIALAFKALQFCVRMWRLATLGTTTNARKYCSTLKPRCIIYYYSCHYCPRFAQASNFTLAK